MQTKLGEQKPTKKPATEKTKMAKKTEEKAPKSTASKAKKAATGPTISLCMIVKNEEEFLPKCLESVKDLVDEMVVVDTGSTDKTVEVAKAAGAKVFDFKWVNDFAKARNFSLTKATKDWILVLDADEVLAEKDFENIRKLIKEAKHPIIYMDQWHYTNNKRNPRFQQVPARYKEFLKGFEGYFKTTVPRLFKNNMDLTFDGIVHETLDKCIKERDLTVLRTDLPIHHYGAFKPATAEKRELYLKLMKEKEKADPQNIKNLHDLAITNLTKNNLKESFNYFKKVYDLDKELLEPYLGMGLIWAKRGDPKRAIKFFLTAMDLKTQRSIEMTTSIAYIRETILYNLALCFLRTGERPKAMQIFKDMIRLNSRFTPMIQQRLKTMGAGSKVQAS